MYDEDYLAHHGIKGQRWGIRRTPEQLGHKPVKKRESKIKKLVDEAAKKKQAERAEKRQTKKEESREDLKEYLRKHPKKITKYNRVLTQEDLDEIVRGIDFDRKLQDIRREDINRGWNKIKDFADHAQTVSLIIKRGSAIYEDTAAIYNTLIDTGIIKNKNPLPEIKRKNKDNSNQQNNGQQKP